MTKVAIPPWSSTGLIPPIDSASPAGPERSPYFVALPEVVLRFGTSAERQRILDGFLRYRARLQSAGMTDGFQWLNGNFLENIEVLEGRSPNDLDVVTFFRLQTGVTQTMIRTADPGVFPLSQAERIAFKSVFLVDSYFVDLEARSDLLVRQSAYWYSMWSHRRDTRWKGYLQVDLASAEDGAARSQLLALPAMGGTP